MQLRQGWNMLAVWNRKDAIPSGNGEGLPIRLSMQDNWDVEEFVSKVCMGRFLNHPAFKITLAVLIIGNALIIASRTETKVEEKYYGLFSAIDNVVLTVLTCEVLLNWYYGFRMYWKDGWNVVNFFIVAYLCVGPFIPVLNNQKIFWVLREEGIALKIGGSLYFFIFITGGAFICTNLLVAVVTSNLEQTMLAYAEEKQKRDQLLHPDKFVDREFDVGDDNSSPELNLVHLKAVMQDTPMTHHQMPLISGNLGNLTEATCDDFCLILEGIQENLKRYKEIRDELSTIVKEVRSIAFNKEQEEERVLRNIQNTNISDGLLSNEVAAGRSGDILSTLMTLEKANMIDPQDVTSSGYHKGAVKMAFLKARRQSLLNQSVPP
ncbi:cation channel sperm-associated protein 4 isoform X4 [Chrysemys picta bellii]|uniref:cation channel sperm-associated protein 4 isoform X4 n=1 Tax=Chrysemys picta bellii TaxID=8478 RepID=UPI0032B27227